MVRYRGAKRKECAEAASGHLESLLGKTVCVVFWLVSAVNVVLFTVSSAGAPKRKEPVSVGPLENGFDVPKGYS